MEFRSVNCRGNDMGNPPHVHPALVGLFKITHATSTQHIFCIYMQTHVFFMGFEESLEASLF